MPPVGSGQRSEYDAAERERRSGADFPHRRGRA